MFSVSRNTITNMNASQFLREITTRQTFLTYFNKLMLVIVQSNNPFLVQKGIGLIQSWHILADQ